MATSKNAYAASGADEDIIDLTLEGEENDSPVPLAPQVAPLQLECSKSLPHILPHPAATSRSMTLPGRAVSTHLSDSSNFHPPHPNQHTPHHPLPPPGLPPNLQHIYTANPYSQSTFEMTLPAALRARPVISFSLLSTSEFTAKAHGILTKEIISSIRHAPGARFDQNLRKWIFPIELHDRLQVALSSLNAFVEPLPRSTLAAVILHHQRQVLRNQPDAMHDKIVEGLKALKSGSVNSDQIEETLPPRLYEALAPFQREGVEFVVKQNEGRAIIADEMGLGKAQPYTSRVLTPSGWRLLGDVKVGDAVTSRDGLCSTITGVYPQGHKMIVRVEFSDGVFVECCEEHLWTVSTDCAKSWTTVSTSQILHSFSISPPLSSTTLVPLCEIPLVSPVEFNPQTPPPLEPYLFGVVLGALSTQYEQIGSLFPHEIIPLPIKSRSDFEFYRSALPKGTLLPLTSLALPDSTQQLSSGFQRKVIKTVLNLACDHCSSPSETDAEKKTTLSDASIPLSFLRSSISSRLALLRGLCDTSTLCDVKGSDSRSKLQLFSLSQSFSETVTELVQSLGGTVSRTADLSKAPTGTEILNLRLSLNPFSLPRKVNWFEKLKQCSSSELRPQRFISSVTRLREDECLCISVSARDRLYVTDHFAVTHNTIQAIAATAMYRPEWPVLVFTPSSARYHWKTEVLKWLSPEVLTEEDVLVVDTAATMSLLDHVSFKFLIVSYSILSKFQEDLLTRRFKVIIADESHYFKNASTQRTKAIIPILQAAARVIMLTGTPALSRPFELFPQLNAVAPMSWSNEKEFTKRYCSGGKSSYGEKKGASNTEELKAILFGTLMISRLKRDILLQLPPKRRHIVNLKITDENLSHHLSGLLRSIKSYEGRKRSPQTREPQPSNLSTSSSFLSSSSSSSARPSAQTETEIGMEEPAGAVQLRAPPDPTGARKAVMMQLFTESGMAKIGGILEHLTKFLDDLMSGKIIIFAHHRSVMDHVAAWLKARETDFIRIDGGTMSKERQKRIEKFQNLSTCRVALLSITSAGVAITLTAASTVYFAELFWTPASLLQAEDRAHRIGQTAEVNIFYFRSHGTIDDLLWPLLQYKIKTLGEVFEGVKFLDIEQQEQEEEEKQRQETLDEDLKTMETLAKQLADEERKGEGGGEGEGEGEGYEEEQEGEGGEIHPTKKQKMELSEEFISEPSCSPPSFSSSAQNLSSSRSFTSSSSPGSSSFASLQPSRSLPFPVSSPAMLLANVDPLSLIPPPPPPPPPQPLDERRMMRAARIRLLREQQRLSQEAPRCGAAIQPPGEVICLLDDDEEEQKSSKPSPLPSAALPERLCDFDCQSTEQSKGEDKGAAAAGAHAREENEETLTAFEMLSECFTASDFSALGPSQSSSSLEPSS